MSLASRVQTLRFVALAVISDLAISAPLRRLLLSSLVAESGDRVSA
jgi:hypothetical protein